MSNVEDEVVSMKFEGAGLQTGISHALSLLDKLKASLGFKDAGKGLNNIQQNMNRFSTGNMQKSLQAASHSWSAMRIVAGTVIATLTHQALIAGEHIVSNFLSPIKNGFSNYEQQINAVQTILANTKSAGTNLHQVTSALNDLNKYANLTIYNFSEMARNIGTFTAAGVGLQQSVDSIKGIANLAALSGSNSQQASTAMYQLSQAIAAGQVHLQDWNSVVNAGMGGTVFQRALAQTAVAMGTLKDNSLKLVGPMKNVSIAGSSFRQSLQTKPGEKSWLTSKVLTNTLAQFTGDLTKAQLKAQGFNDAQIKAINAQAKTAENAATQIKTVSQLTQALKEEVASSWAQVFKTLLGNINQAKKILSPLHTTIENMLRAPVNAFNRLLQGWAKLGGRNVAIMGIKQGFHDVLKVMGAVKAAFRDIFPKQTPQGLYNLTSSFETLMIKLKPSKRTLEEIQRTFRGLFAVVDIVIQVLKGAAIGIETLFSSSGAGQGHVLKFTASIGDLLTHFDAFLKKGGYITKFFVGLAHILAIPIHLIGLFAGLVASIFDGFNNAEADKISGSFQRMSRDTTPLVALFHEIVYLFNNIGKALAPLGQEVGKALGDFQNKIADALKSGNFNAVFDVINTALLGGIVLLIRKFFKHGLKLDFGQGGLIESIKAPFESLTGSLKAMQTNIKAKTLMDIAAAVGILTVSMVALSLINSKDLTKALTAMAGGFTELIASLAILTKIKGGIVQIPVMAAALAVLAFAILELTTAVALMGQLKWETITKGLVGVAGVLTTVALAMRLMPKNMVLQAAALALIGVAVGALAAGVAAFGLIPWKNMLRGLVGLAGALAVIAGAIALMPPTMVLQAVGLAILAKALVLIAAAVGGLGLLSWIQIAKGLVALGGALAIIAGGLYLMEGALPGAAALIVAAGAIALLTPALATLGHLSWTAILKSLLALAGAFTVIGLAGLVLTPLIPSLLGLGAAVLLIGAGMGLAGAGALALATAFSVFVAAASVATGALGGLIGLIPSFATALADGLINFIKELGKAERTLVQVGVKMIVALLKGIRKTIPEVLKTVDVLLRAFLKHIRAQAPDIFRTGLFLLDKFLAALDKKLPRIIHEGANVIIKFLQGIGKESGRISDAAAKMIVKFINGVADAIENNASDLRTAGLHLAWAIVDGMTGGLISYGIKKVQEAVNTLMGHIPGWAKKMLGINSPAKVMIPIGSSVGEGVAVGLDASHTHVKRSTDALGKHIITSMKQALAESKRQLEMQPDIRPRITPVLDLTKATHDAKKIGALLGKHKISAHVTAAEAATVDAQIRGEGRGTGDHTTKVEYHQTINSPKAPDHVQIYRSTQSLLAQETRRRG
jgi:tape measure domain-containing protein